jgi:hypothetical protein
MCNIEEIRIIRELTRVQTFEDEFNRSHFQRLLSQNRPGTQLLENNKKNTKKSSVPAILPLRMEHLAYFGFFIASVLSIDTTNRIPFYYFIYLQISELSWCECLGSLIPSRPHFETFCFAPRAAIPLDSNSMKDRIYLRLMSSCFLALRLIWPLLACCGYDLLRHLLLALWAFSLF